MKYKHYPIAGLDFIFDEAGKPFFLEANSASTVHEEIPKIYGDCVTVKKIARYINHLPGKNICFFVKKTQWNSENKNKSHWLTDQLTNFINKKIHICYMGDNLRVSRSFFLDHNFMRLTLTNFKKGGGNSYVLNAQRRKVKPDIIFRNYFQLNPDFEREGVHVINTMAARDLVWFKHKCYEAVKQVNGINIPKYFLVNDSEELKQVLQQNTNQFKKGYVIKPLGNSLGRYVRVMDSGRMPRKYKVMHGSMVQQRIKPKLLDGKNFWDLRVFVVNGKFAGAVKRVCRQKVTNIAQGGFGDIVDAKLQTKIKDVSEKITLALEKKAEKMATNDYNYVLNPDIPKLREVVWHPIGEE
ncbi:MAG: hypothetical protein QF632_05270 [Candidatus Woesearchaeota archaeon]|jgi:glutathione synthase/RimK-type ligase-like ATP-grasp enzyme|nr:hypothetical protein [Candidatus Woesearchaeota archaeon]MDP7324142.1 hypothetical protein [Candidatus Woesearchaeota archaeon]MDP7458222.1 hypothetical protein [Candidatus Woesearchaeota archaeon]